MRQRFGDLLAAAEKSTVDQEALAELVADASLVGVLMDVPESGAEAVIREGITDVRERVDVRDVLLLSGHR